MPYQKQKARRRNGARNGGLLSRVVFVHERSRVNTSLAMGCRCVQYSRSRSNPDLQTRRAILVNYNGGLRWAGYLVL